ncbi:D-xylose ABC transporter substrate-binding protein [Caloranaerobacter azorensis]|uniref:D-xylose transport system substrate-binding protein n=2 Tax=Caloranaerobacter azorensis TaxID=116090 RepID=A0A1M5VQ84_9FIRM|nr:D-xylose ABC transporter substrate-binding protein [Caloranaerobacter azorensis]QIB26958.1 D-xylose ABC transporter substrate-binding protein [Caloranaerobacter azorensis]SHH77405.1 D-xylose transport system substrate-binding protein [Caloranaerobacter azorensis DSM 13643]
MILKKLKRATALVGVLVLTTGIFAGCSGGTTNKPSDANKGGKDDEIVIGFSMDTLKEERWQKDRDTLMARAKELGVKILIQAANGDDNKQIAQAENLISQGVDVLMVAPHNAEVAATIVEAAHEEGIPVLSYDRLIKNSDVDVYVSFDNEKVGELQAEYVTKLVPKGNYVYIGGAPTDNNAHLFRKGAMNVLKPLIEKGDIKLVYDQMSKDWQPSEAQKHMENALTANKNKIDAVICANDGTAGGAISALSEQQLAGKVPVTGQDAELAACQRIVEGMQTMTVYKPIPKLAETALDVAIKLAKKEKVETNGTVNNGKIDVPSVLLEPIVVDKNNMMDTIIKDGYHPYEEVYKNIPEDQRPKQK